MKQSTKFDQATGNWWYKKVHKGNSARLGNCVIGLHVPFVAEIVGDYPCYEANFQELHRFFGFYSLQEHQQTSA